MNKKYSNPVNWSQKSSRNWKCNEFLLSYGTRVAKILEEVNSSLMRIKELKTKEQKRDQIDESYKLLSHGLTESATKAFNEINNKKKNNSKRSRLRRKKKN